jgi:D-galactarolactone cycloisomerase
LNTPAITEIRTWAIRIPRDYISDRGSAGSPAELNSQPGSFYSLAKTYGTVYSNSIESTLVKVTREDGVTGWGEAQAPVLPEVAQVIVNQLFSPLLIGRSGDPIAIRRMLYEAMRVRGHSGGFYVDAISAIDCALWDIAGKVAGLPVHRMLGGPVRETIPVYISGLAGSSVEEQIADARAHVTAGYHSFKIFLSGSIEDCIELVRRLRAEFSDTIDLFVDALWRLDEHSALRLSHTLAEYHVGWLESPLPPEDIEGHRRLAERSAVPIALGECYRTRHEFLPLLRNRAAHMLQPDIGRSGITEGIAIASLAEAFFTPVSLHISIALGPQIASAVQAAAVMPNLSYVEINPRVLRIAESVFDMSAYRVSPDGFSLPLHPGLGIEPKSDCISRFAF